MAPLCLVFNALVWGLAWWPLRYLQEQGLHPIWATMLFFSLGTVLIGMCRPVAMLSLWRRPELLALAVVAGLTNASFNWGVSTGDVVRVVLLFYLMPLWATLLARFMLHEPITRWALVRLALALVGAALVLKPAGQAWPHLSNLSDVLGLVGGVGFALTNVLLRQQARLPADARAFAMFAGCLVLPGLLGLSLFWQGMVPALPPVAWSWVGVVVAMAGVFFAANMALQYGAAHLPVQRTSVLMLTEVLFAAVSSVWLGGASLTPTILAGGSLILLAAMLATRDEA